MHLLPPVVVGPVIMVIGLSLAPTGGQYGNVRELRRYERVQFKLSGCRAYYITCNNNCARVLQGFLSLIPVLIGIIVGYIVSIFMGLVNFSNIAKANWIDFPHIYLPFKDYVHRFTLV